MPIVPMRAQNALFELQEFCKQQHGHCGDCALKYQCAFLWNKNMFCDLEHPKRADIIYACRETENCVEYITMYTKMRLLVNSKDEHIKKLITEKELLIAERDLLLSTLDKLCPDWKNQIGG